MSRPNEKLKIAIWCLPGEYKKIQVGKLPELINQFDAKYVSIQAKKVQMAPSTGEMKRFESSRNDEQSYFMDIERSLKQRCRWRWLLKRSRYLVNHQFHHLEVKIFDDTTALHLPPTSLASFQAADLLIIIIDENVVDRPVISPRPILKPITTQSDEPGLAYLRKRVKTTEYYRRYQEMLRNDTSFHRIKEISQNTRLTVEDFRASVIKVLNILRSIDKPVALLQVSCLRDLLISQTLKSFLEETNKNKRKKSEQNIRVYMDIANQVEKNAAPHPDDSIQATEIEGFVELFLSELAEIEEQRIRRQKIVRWLFGNDTVRSYRSYEKAKKKIK